ncbi:hypothetical protein PFISCL1PPCAC_11584, partial [Pristionchus fissidentatus]
HEFSHISKLDDSGVFSTVHFFSDLPWHVQICAENSERSGHVKTLGVFICCNEDDFSGYWRCESHVLLKLVNQESDDKSITLEIPEGFTSVTPVLGRIGFLDWDEMMCPQEKFVIDDK